MDHLSWELIYIFLIACILFYIQRRLEGNKTSDPTASNGQVFCFTSDRPKNGTSTAKGYLTARRRNTGKEDVAEEKRLNIKKANTERKPNTRGQPQNLNQYFKAEKISTQPKRRPKQQTTQEPSQQPKQPPQEQHRGHLRDQLGQKTGDLKTVKKENKHLDNIKVTEPFPGYSDPFTCLRHPFWDANPNWEEEWGHTQRRYRAELDARRAYRFRARAFRSYLPNSTPRWRPPPTSWLSGVRSTSSYLVSLSRRHERIHRGRKCKLVIQAVAQGRQPRGFEDGLVTKP